MNFARKQLEKYGWKDGDGLGKECQGMAVALKPHLKTGKEGMGWDLSTDLTDTWWTKAYSDCLSRIQVSGSQTSGEGVVVSIRQDQDQDGKNQNQELGERRKAKKKKDKVMNQNKLYCFEGTEERPMEKMRKRMMQANFTSFSKGGTLLTNGEVISENKAGEAEHNDMEAKETPSLRIVTDEELLKACGGRTAHKAARFGLKLNGKLARIAAQEEKSNYLLLCKSVEIGGSSKSSSVDDSVSSIISNINACENIGESEVCSSSTATDRKRKRDRDQDVEEICNEFDVQECQESLSRKKRKYKKKERDLLDKEREADLPKAAELDTIVNPKEYLTKKGKVKKEKTIQNREFDNVTLSVASSQETDCNKNPEQEIHVSKKASKRKHKQVVEIETHKLLKVDETFTRILL